MATGGEAPLSPRMKAKFNLVLQAVRTGKAQLKEDSQGRCEVECINERTIPLGHVDKSKANAMQVGKNADDTRLLVKACLEMIEAIKRKQVPSISETNHGVVIDQTKIRISRTGQYKEGQDFVCTGEVLGKGSFAGDIVVAMDKETGTEHALKTVMISEFSPHEVRCWLDVGDSDRFPSLYLFQLDGNKVVFHMEKVEHGVTHTDIINSHRAIRCKKKRELIRPFSLWVFYDLLSAVSEMHDKNWAHCDLHGGNVMITKDTMMLKILDFGMARPLREGMNFDHDALKSDILNAIRLFCDVYIGNDFGNNFNPEKKIKEEVLEKELETAPLSKEEREELLQLIMMTYEVTQNPQEDGYGITTPVMECIEDRLFPDKMRDVKRQVAEILFPDGADGDINLREKGEEEVVDKTKNDLDLEDAAKAIPDDLLQSLSICPGEDA